MKHYIVTLEQAIKDTNPDTGAVISVNEYMTTKATDTDEAGSISKWHTRCAELSNAIGKTTVYSECKLMNSLFGELRSDRFGAYFTNPEPESVSTPES